MASGDYVQSGTRTFVAGEALAAYIRVKFNSSSQVVTCGATDAAIGVTDEARASGDDIAVRLLNSQGTFKMTASAAISAAGDIYPSASGKVSSTSSGTRIGMALGAASGSGSIVEVGIDK